MTEMDPDQIPAPSTEVAPGLPHDVLASVHLVTTFYDGDGEQITGLPPHVYREAFTAIKTSADRAIGGSGTSLAAFPLEISVQQAGPSCFDLRFDLHDPRTRMAALMARLQRPRVQAGLELAVMRFVQTSQLVYVLAADPDAEIRTVETPDGPKADIRSTIGPVLRVEPALLHRMAAPVTLDHFRSTQVIATHPSVDHVVASTTAATVPSAWHVSYPVNRHVREVLDGGPLVPLERYLGQQQG